MTERNKTRKKKEKPSAASPARKAAATKGDPASFPIAGIGASAGGLKALEGFFDHIRSPSGIAFVVIQHLDPRRESLLASLLERHSALAIRTIEEGMQAAPDTIYVKPPDYSLVIRHGRFHLQKSADTPAGRLVIDEFFRSLAEDQGENAIAIVLSGAASDGTLGIRAVNAAGGLVMAQDVAQADFDSMPKSAIATGLVDFILPVEKMGEELARYLGHSQAARRQVKVQIEDKRLGDDLQKILSEVRSVTGHDFSGYKRNTVRRRVERRLALHQLDRPAQYVAYLKEHPDEARALFKDLLINVTSFFRDAEPFEILQEEIFRMLGEREPDRLVRAWVPGCATGEEAYTLAILLQETMERLERTFPVKIFATDINPQSIELCREGLYPENIAADLSERRLNRFFIRQGNQYKVSGQLRDMVIFSGHDLTRDPPLSRLDLVSCRNLLIYMDNPLQKKIIPLLHYSLNPGGLLLLGTSEEVGEFTEEHFAPVNRKWKLFRARELSPARRHLMFNLAPAVRVEPPAEEEPTRRTPKLPREQLRETKTTAVRELVESTIMQDYSPPGILVDEHDIIVFFQGETGRYLTLPRGEPTFEVLKLVRGPLAEVLHELLGRVRQERRRLSKELSCPLGGASPVTIDLTVKPMPEAGNGAVLVTFEERERQAAAADEGPGDDGFRVAALQRELYALRQDLQATIEELETLNEGLQSANEELQANNEELETSREELQSTNEELETVNAELKRKNDELLQANDDISNLFGATDIGMLILDTDLRIKRFNPSVTRFFRLIASDLGRPLTDIVTTLNYQELAEDTQEVLRDLKVRSREVLSREGHWYAVHLLPYRTSRNVIAGVILTFTSITDLKRAEIAAMEAKEFAESILATLPEPFLVLDGDLRVVSANAAFYEKFQVSPKGTEGVPVFQLGSNQWDIPELQHLLQEIIPTNSVFSGFHVTHDFPSLGRRTMHLNARRLDQGENDGRSRLILLAFKDVTDRMDS